MRTTSLLRMYSWLSNWIKEFTRYNVAICVLAMCNFHEVLAANGNGQLTYEYWSNIAGSKITDVNFTLASSGTQTLTLLEGPTNRADNYGSRIRGYIIPSASGSYTFYIATDDDGEFYLSTDDQPTNKLKIANTTGWAAPRDWTSNPSQKSAAKSLLANQRYYFEVLHKEAGGGDNVAIGWSGPGISSITVPTGSNINSYVPSGGPAGYTLCSGEGQSCVLSGTQDIAYGANGSFNYLYNQTGSVACGNGTFGDPISGVSKSCYVKNSASSGPTGFSFCSNEGQNCVLSGAQDVAYGANGSFIYKTNQTGTVACNSGNFGSDPIYGVAKACYVKASTGGTKTSSVGINVNAVVSYEGQPNWADAMMTSRDTWYLGGSDVPADANGWPLSDADIYLWEGVDKRQGVYQIYIKGQADVNDQFGMATFSNKQYNAAKNLTTYTMTITDASSQNFIFRIRNTKRTATSPLNSGVQWIKVMKPTALGASTSYDTTVIFTPYYKNALNRYSYFRFMPGTNSNQSVNWSDRTRVDENSQVKQLPGSGSENNGFAWEYKIMLCNDLQKDMWINIPFKVTPDYILQLANQIKNGSTVNGRFYPGLNSNLKIYTELSNELWNYNGGDFQQANQMLDSTRAEIAKGNSPITYDGNTGEGNIRFRFQVMKTVNISNIFRSVFGDAQMMTRIRPLLEWQYDNANESAVYALEFLNNYYNNADGNHVANPHPPNYYIWGGGGAVYYNSNNDAGTTVNDIFNSGVPDNNYEPVTKVEAQWAKVYGLKFTAYEGGMAVGGDGMSGAALAARSDPRAKAAEIESYNIFKKAGGDLYTFGTYAQWQETYTADSSPLIQGIDQINSTATDPAITNGILVNASSPTYATTPTIVNQPWGTSAPKFDWDVTMRGYLFIFNTPGTYTVKIDIKTAYSGGKVAMFVDGVLKNVLDIAASSNYVTLRYTDMYFTAGQHGIMFKPVVKSSGNNSLGDLGQVIIYPGNVARMEAPETINSVVNEVVISPNPASHLLNVNTAHEEGGDISICNPEGKILLKAHTNTKFTSLSLSDLTGGVYIVAIKTANGLTHKKLIIE